MMVEGSYEDTHLGSLERTGKSYGRSLGDPWEKGTSQFKYP